MTRGDAIQLIRTAEKDAEWLSDPVEGSAGVSEFVAVSLNCEFTYGVVYFYPLNTFPLEYRLRTPSGEKAWLTRGEMLDYLEAH